MQVAPLFFARPRAEIKVRYGVGWFGKDRQKQKLNGSGYKTLSVGGWSVTYARMQMKVSESTNVTYDVYPGSVPIVSPEIPF